MDWSAITRAIADQSRTIRLPIHITEKLNKIYRTQRELSQSLGRLPKPTEVAQQLDLPLQEIKDYLLMTRTPLSLDMRAGEEQNTELHDLLEDNHALPEEDLAQEMLKQELRQLIAELPPLQQEVIALRFGLNDVNVLTLVKVGERLNLSRERIRQLQQTALKRLRYRRKDIHEYLA